MQAFARSRHLDTGLHPQVPASDVWLYPDYAPCLQPVQIHLNTITIATRVPAPASAVVLAPVAWIGLGWGRQELRLRFVSRCWSGTLPHTSESLRVHLQALSNGPAGFDRAGYGDYDSTTLASLTDWRVG